MNRFLSNKIIAGIVAVALLAGVGVLVSSGETSSTTRNASLFVAKPCTKPGQIIKLSKQSVVCAALSPKNIWYPVLQEKKWICAKLGITRTQNGVFSVCGKNKSSKKRWFFTKPLMANSDPGLPTTDPDAVSKLAANPELIVETSPATPLAPADTTVTTLAPAVPAVLSLLTQPSGGVNALALETQPVVQLLDQRGASISTAGITITAVSGRTDVVLSGNTAVTDATGRATFTTLSLKGIMGDITLTFTASGLEGITSDKFVLAPGAATQLVNSTAFGSVVSGKAFDQQPVLHLEDSSANVIAVSGVDVSVASSTQGLSGATTVATNKNGIAGFTDLALTQAGATILTFTSGELSTTIEFTVVAGDYTTVKITTEASEAATNAEALAIQPAVQLFDANNNTVTTAGITVTATITQFPDTDTDKAATLLNPTATTDAQGIATFTGLGIAGLIGSYTLGYTPTTGVTQASEKSTTLSAGVATQLIVVTPADSPVGNSEAGTWSLPQSPVIGLRDSSNNPVLTSGVTVTATVTGQDPTTAQTNAQGEATIGLIFSGDDAGDRKITYSALRLVMDPTTITLPLLTPVVQAWVLPTDQKTTSPAFTLAAPTSNSNGAWTYTSSKATIATVTSTSTSTVTVTPEGAPGTATITATQAATAKYASVSTTATLGIGLIPAVVSSTWELPTDTTTTSQAFAPTAPTSNSNGGWTYESSDATFATVTAAGLIAPQDVAGTVTITATQAATTKFASVSTTATLVIGLTPAVVSSTWELPTGKTPTSREFALTAPTSNSDGAWTYESSDATIAIVDATGLITPQDVAGEVTITATQAATTKFASVSTTATLVIGLTPTVVSPAWELPTGKTTTSPAFTPRAPTSNSNGGWTYESSDATIATVDATGLITPQDVAGEVTITATQAATTKFASVSTTTTLVIGLTPAVVSSTWKLPTGTTTTSPAFAPTAPTSNSNGAWTYESSDATIATVFSEVLVTPQDVAGEVTITATQAATTKFASVSTTATLVIGRAIPVLQAFAGPWELPTDTTTTSPNFAPTSPTSNSNGGWTYESSDATFATVTTTGLIAPQDVAGTVTITATQAATPKFASVSTTATLVIGLTPAVVSSTWTLPTGKTPTSREFALRAPTSNSNGAWTYTSSDATIATVTTAGLIAPQDVAGEVTITATQAATTKFASVSTTATLVIGLTPAVVSKTWTLPTGKTTTSQAFTPTPPASNSNGGWTYESSDATIATVTPTGLIAPQDVAGTVTITATQAATPKFASVSTTADLVIGLTPAVVSSTWVLPTDKTTTSQAFTPTAPTSNSNGAWTYESSDAAFATVTTAGQIAPQDVAGTVTITATQAATTKFAGVSTTADLVIGLTPAVVSSTWELPTGKTTTSQAFTPTAPESNSDGAWTYASSKPATAIVTTAGQIAPQDVAGEVTITATQAATTKFASTETTATLVIGLTPAVAKNLTVPIGLTTTSPKFPLTDPESNSDGAWTYASDNTDVATVTGDVVTITGAGSTTITATQKATTKYTGTTQTDSLSVATVPSTNTITTAPAGAVNGVALVTQPVVQLVDVNGVAKQYANVVVTVSSSRTDVVLSGNTAVTNNQGIATFTNLTLVGIMGDVDLTFTPAGLVGARTSLKLTAGAPMRLVSSANLRNVVSGKVLSPSPVLHLQDASGNRIATSGTTVTVTAPNTFGLAGSTSATTNTDGDATFDGLSLKKSGTTALTFSAGEIETQDTVTVVASDHNAVEVIRPASTTAANDDALAIQPQVQLIDENGNNVTTGNVVVTVKIVTSNTATLPVITSATATTNASGIATFKNLTLTGLVGSYLLSYSPSKSLGIPGATTNEASPTELAPGTRTALRIVTAAAGPSANTSTGVWSLATAPVIALYDTSGNAVGQSGVVITAQTTQQDAKFTATTDDNGRATFTDMTFTGAASGRTITYSASRVTSNSQSIDLDIMASGALALTVPTGLITTSDPFRLTDPESNSNGAWTYASDNTDVATVTGDVVTITGAAGTAKITATQVATPTYSGTTTLTDLVIALTPAVVSSTWTLPTGKTTTSQAFTPTAPKSTNENGAWTYTSSQPATATVTTAGQIAPQDVAGTVTITATQAATTKFASVSTTATLVIGLTPTVVSPAWVLPTDKITTSQAFTPTAPKSTNETGAWTYASSQPATATVTTAGQIAPQDVAGEVIITATQAATAKFAGVSTTATLVIGLTPTVVSPTWVLPAGMTTTSREFTPTAPTSNSNGAWTYESSKPTIATVTTAGQIAPQNVAGEVIIKATHAATAKYGFVETTATLVIGLTPTVVSPAWVLPTGKTAMSQAFTPTAPTSNDSNGAWTYASSQPATATVTTAGQIAPISVGTTIIKATHAATAKYGFVETTATLAISSSCATAEPYPVGQTGPGGGIVFYAAYVGTLCYKLEVAPTDYKVGTTTSKAEWGCTGTSVMTATQRTASLAIGQGRANTQRINEALCKGQTGTASAASLAKAYNGGGMFDWFLPSKDELNQLCRYARGLSVDYTAISCLGTGTIVPGFSSDRYWSSSESDPNINAWLQKLFTEGTQYSHCKVCDEFVRPVREFRTYVPIDYKAGDTGPAGGGLTPTVVSPTWVLPTDKITTSQAFTLGKPTSNDSYGAWTYTSSNATIATVTPAGEVTVIGIAGTVRITATHAATTMYQSVSTTADLVIGLTPAVVSSPWGLPGDKTTTSDAFALTAPTSTNTTGGWTYTSSDATIATVDDRVFITPRDVAGTVKITATQEATRKFASVFTTFDLVIGLAIPVLQAYADPWQLPSQTTTSQAFPPTAPTSTNTTGGWTYASSNATIATVTTAGQIAPQNVAGTVRITATQAATTKFQSTSTTADLVIGLTPTVVSPAWVLPTDKIKTSPVFTLTPPTSNDSDGAWTYTSSPTTFATVTTTGQVTPKGVGTTSIKATHAATAKYGFVETTATLVIAPSCATAEPYAVGQTGPGGGIVFYAAFDGTKCYKLEAATANGTTPSTWIPAIRPQWCSSPTNVMDAAQRTASLEIGRGRANTNMLTEATCNLATSAASVAKAYNGGGKTDWFLPSQKELNELCKYAKIQTTGNTTEICKISGTLRSGFAVGNYWSSSEYNVNYAWLLDLQNGGQPYWNTKTNNDHVRPVREFQTDVPIDYQVGDRGPGGGIVFYVAPTSFKCGVDMTADCKYLEAATANGTTPSTWTPDTNAKYGCSEVAVMTDTQRTASLEIGRGQANTNMTINCGTSIAASIAKAYNGGGKTDWFLPSQKELNELCKYARTQTTGNTTKQCDDSGTFRSGFAALYNYWSSSELDANGAWVQNLLFGSRGNNNKVYASSYVRPVRAFGTVSVATTVPVAFKVGDAGPGGGIVFYVATTLFACGENMEATCKYLEAATTSGTTPSTWTPATTPPWGCYGTDVMTSAQRTASAEIGRGRANTKMITEATCNVSTSAASIAKAYNGGGKADWFLPSKKELNELCKYARTQTTGNTTEICANSGALRSVFAFGGFWSSSEFDASLAGPQYFNYGGQSNDNKNLIYYVRPVRAFGTVSVATTVPVALQVGEAGPGGGIVFYVAPTSFKCGVDMTADCKYLEAATTNGTATSTWTPATTAPWCSSSTDVMDVERRAASLEIGRGRANTNMITGCSATSAASIAKAYNGGGKTDWFVPSQKELNELCKYARNQTTGNTTAICGISGPLRSGFSSDYYWSSSETNAYGAWDQYFGNGVQGKYSKFGAFYVRPVRAS